MKVPFVSFLPMEKELNSDLRDAFNRVFTRSWYIDGLEDETFEKVFAEYCGTEYCVGVGNGLDALILSLKALGMGEGDEIIVPSNTYIATALAVTYVGAKPVFVEPKIETFNINPEKIETAITDKTKVICLVHYAGVACDMDRFCHVADKYNLILVEDAAQAVVADYKGKRLGTFGRFGCYSFHETKNFSMGEGGAILLNDPADIERAEILREKGTDRSRFFLGLVDKYTWRDKGSSYLPSDINAAYLWAQLEQANAITSSRLHCWDLYYSLLSPLADHGLIELPYIPKECTHNAHMFFIKVRDISERTNLISFLRERNIYTVFHYVPLHTAEAGLKYGRFDGEDIYTTSESERLIRLPMYYGLEEKDVYAVSKEIKAFFQQF